MNKCLIIACLVLCSSNLMAQDEVIDLYDDLPPYSTGIKTEEVWEGYRVSNVQNPQLYVYRADSSNNNGGAVIYIPGGGYRRLAIYRKGANYAEFFREMGMTTFVLKYRLPVSNDLEQRHLVPLTDATRAIQLIRSKADEYGIDKEKLGIMGGSAGGHLASSLSTNYELEDSSRSGVIDQQSSRPSFAVLIYPVISNDSSIVHQGSMRNLIGPSPSTELLEWFSNENHVTENTPPTFLVHGYNDQSVSVLNSVRYYEALFDNGVKAEMHLFQDGKHGAGSGKEGEPWAQWLNLCKLWLETHILE